MGHGRPDKAREFPRHRDDRHGGPLAVADEMSIAAMQPLLRPPCFADDSRRLVDGMAREPRAQGRPMAIVPGGLDQHATRVRVARFGEGTAALALARGVLAGYEAQIAHEGAGR